MMTQDNSIKKRFGEHLAHLLGEKIFAVYPNFDVKAYVDSITCECVSMSYTQRIILHAETLKKLLPESYPEAITILM